jgi:hypothetical protein
LPVGFLVIKSWMPLKLEKLEAHPEVLQDFGFWQHPAFGSPKNKSTKVTKTNRA